MENNDSKQEKMNNPISAEELQKLFSRMSEINKKVDTIMTALVGSDIAQDGGLVKRLFEAEKRLDEFEQKMNNFDDHVDRKFDELQRTVLSNINQLKIKSAKHETLVKIMWGLAAAVITSLTIFIVTQVISNVNEKKMQNRLNEKQQQIEQSK